MHLVSVQAEPQEKQVRLELDWLASQAFSLRAADFGLHLRGFVFSLPWDAVGRAVGMACLGWMRACILS